MTPEETLLSMTPVLAATLLVSSCYLLTGQSLTCWLKMAVLLSTCAHLSSLSSEPEQKSEQYDLSVKNSVAKKLLKHIKMRQLSRMCFFFFQLC